MSLFSLFGISLISLISLCNADHSKVEKYTVQNNRILDSHQRECFFHGVNVIYKSGANAEPITLGQVPNQEACTPDKAAWYYDNPADPTKIIVCDATCAAIQADDDAELEILFGCITIPA